MVLPDGTPRSEERPGAWRHLLAWVGGIGLMAGVLALGALTTPGTEPETSESARPVEPIDPVTFEIADIATGHQLAWDGLVTFEDAYPLELLVHRGLVYLFTAQRHRWTRESQPVSAWVSPDGRDWHGLGEVLDLVSGPVGFVSTPRGLATVEGADRGIDILTSDDGLAWGSEHVEFESLPPGATVWPTALAVADREMAVAASYGVDLAALVEEALERSGSPLDLDRFGWSVEASSVVVYGPLGLVVERVELDDLGLIEEQHALVEDGYPMRASQVWYFHEELGWQGSILEDVEWVNELIFHGPELIAFGQGRMMAGSWSSFDGGVSWEERDTSDLGMSEVLPWEGRVIGLMGDGLIDLQVRAEDGTWEGVGLAPRFPPRLGWYAGSLAAGDGGVAFTANSWSYGEEWSTRYEPVALSTGDATLEIDLSQGTVVLEKDGTTHVWPIGNDNAGIGFDLADDTIMFSDPETGEHLASFPIGEIVAAEERFWEQGPTPETLQAIVYSPDLERWTVQDGQTAFGRGRSVVDLAVTGDRMVALVQTEVPWRQAPGGPFEIRSAPLP